MDLQLEPSQLSFFERNVAQKRWHYVHFHESEPELADNICRFLQPALRPKHVGIVTATAAHVPAMRVRARIFGLDLRSAEARGQFVPLDAEEPLSRIMLNGLPGHMRSHVILQGLLQKTAEAHPYLRIYGEMVALFWQQGNERGRNVLEELWNNLGRMRPLSLLCGYPRALSIPRRTPTISRASVTRTRMCMLRSGTLVKGVNAPCEIPSPLLWRSFHSVNCLPSI